ncbi:MAG: hypothetical protein IT406_01565 [Candidatus Yanofskybacteria bacterium]|nr:hypothetical protein [Candidatus Yanofskybacteria bacterium]
MTSQPPLIDPIGPALPGPLFTPRPGWGGKLRAWLTDHAYLLVFRVVLLVALLLIGRSLWHARSLPSTSPAPTPTPVIAQNIALTARPGDGLTDLAARAIDLLLASGSATIRLDAAQHLFAVDSLARAMGWRRLLLNEELLFKTSDITAAVLQALTLSPSRHAAWERLLSTR